MNFSNNPLGNERELRAAFYKALGVKSFDDLAKKVREDLFSNSLAVDANERRRQATTLLQSLPFFHEKTVNYATFSQYIEDQNKKGALYPELELLQAFSLLAKCPLQFFLREQENYVKSTTYKAPTIKGDPSRKKVPLVLKKGKNGKIIMVHLLPSYINIDELSDESSQSPEDESVKKESSASPTSIPTSVFSRETALKNSPQELLGNTSRRSMIGRGNIPRTHSSQVPPVAAAPSFHIFTEEDRRISSLFYQAIGTENLSTLLQELKAAINQHYTVQACPSRPDTLRQNTIYVFPSEAGKVKFVLQGQSPFDLSLGNLQSTLRQNCIFSQPVSLKNANEIIDLVIREKKIKGETSLKPILDSMEKVRFGANGVNSNNFSEYMRYCASQNALYPDPQILLAYAALKNKHISFFEESNENYQLMDSEQYVAEYSLTSSIFLNNINISPKEYIEEAEKIHCIDLLVSDRKLQVLIPNEPTNITAVNKRGKMLLKSAFTIAAPPPLAPLAPAQVKDPPGIEPAGSKPKFAESPLRKNLIVGFISRNIPSREDPLFNDFEELLQLAAKIGANNETEFFPALLSYLRNINAPRELVTELEIKGAKDSFLVSFELQEKIRTHFADKIAELHQRSKQKHTPATYARAPSLQPTHVNEPAFPRPASAPPPPPRAAFNVYSREETRNDMPMPWVFQASSLSLADRIIEAIAKNRENDLSKVVFWGMCNNSSARRGTMRTGFGFESVKIYLKNIRAEELLYEIDELDVDSKVHLEKEVYQKILSNFLREINAAREDFLSSLDPSRRTTRKQPREDNGTAQKRTAIPADVLVRVVEAAEAQEEPEVATAQKIDSTEAARLLKLIRENKYYEVFGLEKTAIDQQIKTTYKKLALHWHPDKNPGEEAIVEDVFKGIVEAYSILGDKDLRREYDESLLRGNRMPSSSEYPPRSAPKQPATPATSRFSPPEYPQRRYQAQAPNSAPFAWPEYPPRPAPKQAGTPATSRFSQVEYPQRGYPAPTASRKETTERVTVYVEPERNKPLEMTEENVRELAKRVVQAIDKKQELAFPP